MLNLNPPSASSFTNPEVDTLCDHVNEIALQSEEAAAEGFKVIPLPPLTPDPPSPMETSGDNGFYSDEECKTPRGEKYKIPEITTCPPAPKRPKNTKNLLSEGFTVKSKLDSSEIEELLKERDEDVSLSRQR